VSEVVEPESIQRLHCCGILVFFRLLLRLMYGGFEPTVLHKQTALTNAERERILGEELLTVEELTAWLKVKREWIYARIHSDTLPFP
jgi:hypothetical protein